MKTSPIISTIKEIMRPMIQEAAEQISVNVARQMNRKLDLLRRDIAHETERKRISGQQLEQYLTRKDVTARFKVSRQTLFKMEQQGLLKPTKIGRTVRYKLSDLETTLNSYTLNKTVKNHGQLR